MDNEKRGNGFSIVIAFFIGGLIGTALSLLFAPLTGRETRDKIRGASNDAKEKTVEVAHKTKDRVNELVDQGKERIYETKGGMKAAVEAGKKAFVQKKVEIAEEMRDEEETGEEVTS